MTRPVSQAASDRHGERQRRRRDNTAEALQAAIAVADFSERGRGALRGGDRRRTSVFVERLVWLWSNHVGVSADMDTLGEAELVRSIIGKIAITDSTRLAALGPE
jgi:uncharacterized protein (DUF1800 family)